MKVDVTISIVHYKTPNLLIKCIRSVYKHTKNINYEIIVINNSSEVDLKKKIKIAFPEVKYVENKNNNFATGGNNQAFKLAKGEYFLVLNPDMEFSENVILKMKNYLVSNPKVAAITCLQHYSDGTIQKVCSKLFTPRIEFLHFNMIGRFFIRNNSLDEYWYKEWDRKTTKTVEAISDTIMLIRSNVARKLNLYDENIKLMYMENDLSKRINDMNLSVRYYADTKVLHHVGQSTNTLTRMEYFKIFNEDRLYYYKKHFGLFWWGFLYITFKINYFYYLLEPQINKIRNK